MQTAKVKRQKKSENGNNTKFYFKLLQIFGVHKLDLTILIELIGLVWDIHMASVKFRFPIHILSRNDQCDQSSKSKIILISILDYALTTK